MLHDISSATLRKITKLLERKEALMSQIQELDRQMARLQPASWVHPAKVEVRTSRRGVRRVDRGVLKAKIIKALRAAGPRGLTIRQISDKLRVKTANLYVWFNGTGRNVPGLRKIGAAKYRLR